MKKHLITSTRFKSELLSITGNNYVIFTTAPPTKGTLQHKSNRRAEWQVKFSDRMWLFVLQRTERRFKSSSGTQRRSALNKLNMWSWAVRCTWWILYVRQTPFKLIGIPDALIVSAGSNTLWRKLLNCLNSLLSFLSSAHYLLYNH